MLSRRINKEFFRNLMDKTFDSKEALQHISLKWNNKLLSIVPNTWDLTIEW